MWIVLFHAANGLRGTGQVRVWYGLVLEFRLDGFGLGLMGDELGMGRSPGELGPRLGLSGFALDSAWNDELESSLKGTGSGPEGGIHHWSSCCRRGPGFVYFNKLIGFRRSTYQ